MSVKGRRASCRKAITSPDSLLLSPVGSLTLLVLIRSLYCYCLLAPNVEKLDIIQLVSLVSLLSLSAMQPRSVECFSPSPNSQVCFNLGPSFPHLLFLRRWKRASQRSATTWELLQLHGYEGFASVFLTVLIHEDTALNVCQILIKTHIPLVYDQ